MLFNLINKPYVAVENNKSLCRMLFWKTFNAIPENKKDIQREDVVRHSVLLISISSNMGLLKIKLDFNSMLTLMSELTESEILAISLMAAGQEMTETVKKSDLVSIIALLMRKLNWVVEDKEAPGVDFEIEKNIEHLKASSTNDCPENTANTLEFFL